MAGAVIVAAAGLAVVAWNRPRPDAPVLHLEITTPPSRDPASFELSPDGRQLAFVAGGDGESKLWIRPLDQASARELAGTEGASYPFWSPDGRAIAFFAGGKVKRVDLPDGRLQVLADSGPVGRGGTWNTRGNILYATANSGIHLVGEAGGPARAVTTAFPGGGSQRFPSFLPDGRRFLFFVAFGRPESSGLYIGSLDGSEPRRLIAGETPAVYVRPGYLVTTRQGALVAIPFDADTATITDDALTVAPTVGIDWNSQRGAFSASATDLMAMRSSAITRRRLVWVDRGGRILTNLGMPDDSAMIHPELSPDGRTVAVQRTEAGNFDVWLVGAADGMSNRFTFDGGVDSAPLWSDDGRRILFRSTRNGIFDLFAKPASGEREEALVFASPENKFPLDWARDGTVLYAIEHTTNGTDLWAIRPGGSPPVPVTATVANEDEAQFSPDERWVLYRSNERGRSEIYIRPFNGSGALTQVSSGGGEHPRWRADGKEVFYVAPDNHLMAVGVDVSPAGAIVLGAVRRLFATRLPAIGSKPQYAVSPDGQRFLMNVVDEEAALSSVTIVQNWLRPASK